MICELLTTYVFRPIRSTSTTLWRRRGALTFPFTRTTIGCRRVGITPSQPSRFLLVDASLRPVVVKILSSGGSPLVTVVTSSPVPWNFEAFPAPRCPSWRCSACADCARQGNATSSSPCSRGVATAPSRSAKGRLREISNCSRKTIAATEA